MEKRIIKRSLLAGTATSLLVFALLYWPVPIEGFWKSPLRMMGPGITFYLFDDGKVLHYYETGKAIAWFANYEKVGWNKYHINCPGPQPANYIFRTGLIRSKGVIFGNESERIRGNSRYFHVFNNNKVRWVTPIWEQSILVTNQNGYKEFFFNGRKLGLIELGDRISNDRIKRESSKVPIQVYSSTNGIPCSLLTSIASNNFKYVLHTNAHWVAELDRVYIQVSTNTNSQLDYSIKYKLLHQGDLRNVGIERIEKVFQKNSQDEYGWYTARPDVITILTHSSFDISQLLAVMERVGQKYEVIINDLWIEKTDRRSFSLLYFEDSFLGYCHFNGHGCLLSDLKYDLASFQNYRELISRPVVVYAHDRQVPVELARILEDNRILYQVKPSEILCKKDYPSGGK